LYGIPDGMGELGGDGARILADFLHCQATSLTCLHLNYNELGDLGVSIILEPFSACRNVLEELSLNQNEIEESGAEALVRAKLPMLKLLCLEDNDEIKKRYIKETYGGVANFGEDEDDNEEEEEEADDMMDALVTQMTAAKL
jgi:hypothetical protein